MRKPNRTTVEALFFLLVLFLVFGLLGTYMGGSNMVNTIMKTAHDLLLNTVFYLMGITVLTGALSKLMSEFGIVKLLERVLRPLMKPLYNLPGVAALGGVMTFLSDNPAIITLSKDKTFSSYFKKYQLLSLTNFGTAFGMGFVVIITMIGLGYVKGALIGLFGAICGSIISTRLMQRKCLRAWPELDAPVADELKEGDHKLSETEEPRKDGIFMRFLNAALDGGKNGVDLGLQIIPGVLIISTAVMMITFDAGTTAEGVAKVYDGSAYQGVPVLTWLADKIHWVFEWLFGFSAMELIAFPMTALGAVGAALGLLPTFNTTGLLDGNAVAVFTAIGMCWSGFLSTHTAMLDSLGFRRAIPKAIGAHAVAGLCAGIIAHFLYVLVTMISGGDKAPGPVVGAETVIEYQQGDVAIHNGDLLFIGIPADYDVTGSMSGAIADATSSAADSLRLIHVAIAEVDALGQPWVIDATLAHGVHRHLLHTTLSEFRLQGDRQATYFVKRVDLPQKEIDAFVEKAKAFCGEEYDIYFRPDNGLKYCTELVRDSYRTEDGDYLFSEYPMNWKDADGKYPEYWVWLFGQLGVPIPQGEPGTNPDQMSREPILKDVGQFIPAL